MAKDPTQRPPDAAAFLAELEDAARDRYGADWLTRASIAGLAGAGALATGANVAAAGSTATAPAVVSDTATAVTGRAAKAVVVAGTPSPAVAAAAYQVTAPPRPPRRSRVTRGPAIAAVATAAVVLALLGGTGVVLAHQATKTAPDTSGRGTSAGKARPPGAANSTATGAPFSGTYNLVTTITARTGSIGSPVGEVRHLTWKVTPACAAGPCDVMVDQSANGKSYHFTLAYADGKWSGPTPAAEPCPTSTVIFRQIWTVAPASGTDANGEPPLVALTGIAIETIAAECRAHAPPFGYTSKLELTRSGD